MKSSLGSRQVIGRTRKLCSKTSERLCFETIHRLQAYGNVTNFLNPPISSIEGNEGKFVAVLNELSTKPGRADHNGRA
jgi:hypothetical protein